MCGLIFISMGLLTTNWIFYNIWSQFLKIYYSGDVWVMLMVVCMIVGILLAIINRYSPSEWSKIPEAEDKTNSRDSFTVNNALFFVHTTVCWQGKRVFFNGNQSTESTDITVLGCFFFFTKTRIGQLIWF